MLDLLITNKLLIIFCCLIHPFQQSGGDNSAPQLSCRVFQIWERNIPNVRQRRIGEYIVSQNGNVFLYKIWHTNTEQDLLDAQTKRKLLVIAGCDGQSFWIAYHSNGPVNLDFPRGKATADAMIAVIYGSLQELNNPANNGLLFTEKLVPTETLSPSEPSLDLGTHRFYSLAGMQRLRNHFSVKINGTDQELINKLRQSREVEWL